MEEGDADVYSEILGWEEVVFGRCRGKVGNRDMDFGGVGRV